MADFMSSKRKRVPPEQMEVEDEVPALHIARAGPQFRPRMLLNINELMGYTDMVKEVFDALSSSDGLRAAMARDAKLVPAGLLPGATDFKHLDGIVAAGNARQRHLLRLLEPDAASEHLPALTGQESLRLPTAKLAHFEAIAKLSGSQDPTDVLLRDVIIPRATVLGRRFPAREIVRHAPFDMGSSSKLSDSERVERSHSAGNQVLQETNLDDIHDEITRIVASDDRVVREMGALVRANIRVTDTELNFK
jgi:hypothetical protein